MKFIHLLKQSISLNILPILLGFVVFQSSASAQAPTLSDVSLLPETIASGLAVRPNVLLVFDTSDEMKKDLAGMVVGADNTQSKSFLARAAVTTALDDYDGEIQLGLMTYDGLSATGGILQASVKDFSSVHKSSIEAKLASELVANTSAVLSNGGIQTEGVLRDAKDYFDDSLLAQNASGEAISYLTPQACEAPIFVIMVTAGVPDTSPAPGSRHDGDCPGTDNTVCAADAAAELLAGDDKVKTFVIAFDSMLTTGLNTIATDGGSRAIYASTAAQLSAAIVSALDQIYVTSEVGSASGISVISSSSTGKGSFVQATFNSLLEDSTNGDRIFWTGDMNAYFIDQYGFFREDTNNNVQLDTTDLAFRSEFDDATNEVVVTTFGLSNVGTASFAETNPTTGTLDDLNSIWSAADNVNALPDANIHLQRGYGNLPAASTSTTEGSRHIFTWLQTDPTDENFHSGSMLDLIYDGSADLNVAATSINQDNYGLIAGTPGAAESIIQFIRGKEIPGMRSRTLGTDRYILGDMVHSSAVQLDTPTEFYDTKFDILTYATFREQYKNRRRMVYVGGNDGMLHAFNGGFYDDVIDKFFRTHGSGGDADYDGVNHELGAEIWAYVPMNLLPHLKFLSDPSYDSSRHVAFVDGPIQTFDVKIFDDDAVHPDGWGTILIAGMRLGGTPYPGVEYTQVGGTPATFEARSAYIILDVTDPRLPPEVLGEISPPNLGYTLGTPDVMTQGTDASEWYLVFGSGPNTLASATVTDPNNGNAPQDAYFYRYKLDAGTSPAPGFDSNFNGENANGILSGDRDAFVGDVIAVDWNGDFGDDVAYFGTASGTEAATDGALHRYLSDPTGVTSGSLNIMLDTGTPIISAPAVASHAGEAWVFAGSGRYLTGKDSENIDTNYAYGLIEGFYPTIADSTLVDVSDVVISRNDTTGVETLSGISIAGVDSYSDLRAYILDIANGKFGWKSEIKRNPVNNSLPSAKHTASPLIFKNLMFYTSYDPPMVDNNLCLNEFGTSYLSVVDLVTGTTISADEFDGPLGKDGNDFIKTTKIGSGYAFQSYLFIGPDPVTGDARVSVKSPTGSGAIPEIDVDLAPIISGRTSWLELEIQ